MNYPSGFLCYTPTQAGNKLEETMPATPPDIAGHIPADPAEPGFTDDAFDARYDSKRSHVVGSPAADQANANSHADPTSPRSRNSFMRARARRLSAGVTTRCGENATAPNFDR
jgi:hypothetical protein